MNIIKDRIMNIITLRDRGAKPARLYGLAKVHKNGIPLHPVLYIPESSYYSFHAIFW